MAERPITAKIELAGITPERLTRIAVAHRQAVEASDIRSCTTSDSQGDLFVTNDGASGNFRVRTMRLDLAGILAIVQAAEATR